jgi:hypothetical protein
MRKGIIAAVGLGVATSLLAAPVPAGAAAGGEITSFLFDADSGKGLVALSQNGSRAELSFQFFGLRPRTEYRLVVSSRGCTSAKGTIVSRDFRTNPRGSSWDPVAVQSTARPASARLVRPATGRTVACEDAPDVAAPALGDVSKIANATPGVLVVNPTVANWRVRLSLGGLMSSATYQLFAFEGPCARNAPVLGSEVFKASRKGTALRQLDIAAVPGKSIGSVGVLRRGQKQVVFCSTL